jgi:hypothetical protein
MSTSYTLIPNNGASELELLERSGEADLVLFMEAGGYTIRHGMDAHELARIGLEFLKVSKYLDPDFSKSLTGQDEFILTELDIALEGPLA